MTQVASTSRQPSFTMPWQERQSRLTTFFRLFTALPGVLWLAIWSLALIVTVPVAWFAILFTGRYPEGLYAFNASFARYATHVYGYFYLGTDEWPGFSGDPAAQHPVRLGVGPPLPVYNRLKTGFRFILLIPVGLIAYAMNIVAQIAAVISWFTIVFTGKQPRGVYSMLHLGLSYQQRAAPYYLLLTEDWPTFTVDSDRAALEPAPPSDGAPAPATAAPEPATGPAPVPPPSSSGSPPNLGDFRPPVPPDDAA
jgi:hypothetical protein